MNCLCMGPCLIWIHRNSNLYHAYYVNTDSKKSKKPLRVTRINLDNYNKRSCISKDIAVSKIPSLIRLFC